MNPNNPVPTRYDDNIKRLKHKIQRKKGPNDRLRSKLDRLKTARFSKIQRTPEGMPWNAAYETALGTANRDFNQANANIAQQQQQSNQMFGFGDTSNPFSRAAMLQQAYQRSRANTLNTYAGRGQLYSGSTQNALGYDASNFNQGLDALQREYAAQNQEFAQSRLQNQNALTDAQQAAYAQALEDALNSRPEGAPGLPRYVKRSFKRRIRRAEKRGKKGRAKHLRERFRDVRNPDPMLPKPPPGLP